MFESIITSFLVIQTVASFLCFIRAIMGPTMQDRVIALDTVGLLLVGFVCLIMILHETVAYTEIILVIGILAFVGSIALAKFLERGAVFDRN